MRSLSDRFWGKVYVNTLGPGCWLWVGAINPDGYGTFQVATRQSALAHRVAWELTHGPIPDGAYVLHHCDVPGCVNPGHLFIGSQADNVADMMSKGRHGGSAGAANGRAKLTRSEVAEIRSRYKAGNISQSALARQYRVAQQLVSRIVRGEAWQ